MKSESDPFDPDIYTTTAIRTRKANIYANGRKTNNICITYTDHKNQLPNAFILPVPTH
jgi:hypothetical protein